MIPDRLIIAQKMFLAELPQNDPKWRMSWSLTESRFSFSGIRGSVHKVNEQITGQETLLTRHAAIWKRILFGDQKVPFNFFFWHP